MAASEPRSFDGTGNNLAHPLWGSAGQRLLRVAAADARGRYRLDAFRETGDYQVRLVVPPRFRATTAEAVDLLISRGDEAVSGLAFGLRMRRGTAPPRPWNRDAVAPVQHLAAVDAAFAGQLSASPTSDNDPSTV